MKIYQVGGCVRDKLLNLPVKDRDWVVVGAQPKDLLSQGYQQVGKDFPVFLHPDTRDEYALARTERKTAKGYYGFECDSAPTVTLEQDLQRRDLTINAMALDESGDLIDPYQGKKDLGNKILRHVSEAFIEDPLRILRVARFKARFSDLKFDIAPETQKLMKNMVLTGELEALVPERVWQEFQRALTENHPRVFFETLKVCGALAVLFPALNQLWGVPQVEKWHPEVDTGLHVMMALEQAVKFSTDPVIRFAVLCHDLGKGVTKKEQWPSHKGHEAAGVPLVEAFCKKYKVPNQYRDLAVQVSRYHLHTHKAFELKASTILKLFENLDAFRKPPRFEQFLTCCYADATGRGKMQEAAYPQVDFLKGALQAAKVVSPQPFVEQGLEGEKIKEAIYRARIKEIERFKKEKGTDLRST